MKTWSILPLCAALAVAPGCNKAAKKEKTEAATTAVTAAPSASAASKPSKPQIPAPPDVAAPPANAEVTSTGLASVVIQPGTGTVKPTEWDSVKVHYTGWTKDGVTFDSSIPRNQPLTFKLKGVIPGWTEGLQLMTVGEKRRFWIPGKLAYGDTPRRPGAPAGQLTFDVELLEVKEGPKPPPTPEDVAAPPPTALKTKTGLAYRVLKKGTGKVRPKASDYVQVHYSGWTTDGKMFDSSVTRGNPSSFGLGGVIPGWTEGLQLMVEGEQTRFWIPSELAYNNKPGKPAGMLVFDVELLKIQDAPMGMSPHGPLGAMGKPAVGAAPTPNGTRAPAPATSAKPAPVAPKVPAAPKPVAPAPAAPAPAPVPAPAPAPAP